MICLKNSLALKLSLAILLVAVVIFVVSMGVLFERSRNIIRSEAVERATSVLNAAQMRATRYLKEVEIASNSIEWLAEDHFVPDSLLAYSRRVVALNPHISGCCFSARPNAFSTYGRCFTAYSVRRDDSITTGCEVEFENFDKIWYKTPQKLRRACWVDPLDDFRGDGLSANDMVAAFCKPLYDADHQFLGVMVSDLPLDSLACAMASQKPYPHSYYVMIGMDGHYFIHPDSAQLSGHTIFSGRDSKLHADIMALGRSMTQGQQGFATVDIDGETCLVCYKPLSGTPWSLALVSPESDVYAKYHRLIFFIVPLTLLGLAFILLFTRKLVAYAIRPLKQLARQSQLMAEGDCGTPLRKTRRRDIMGKLQNSFAAMQESLANHVAHINKANATAQQHNEELQRAGLLAQEAARQKTAFMQNMTHQIRTPLNIIVGFSQILADEGHLLPAEDVDAITMMIDHNMVTLTRMAAMLYDSSDTGTVSLALDDIVSVNEVMRECVGNTCRQYPKLPLVAFRTSLPDAFCIKTNRLYLFRCICELLYNAAKYSDGQHIALSATATEESVTLVVEDTGPGIPSSEMERLFMPFSKTDDLTEGLGLGLPLARRHARNMGGQLNIDTTYTQGCRMILCLPNNSREKA